MGGSVCLGGWAGLKRKNGHAEARGRNWVFGGADCLGGGIWMDTPSLPLLGSYRNGVVNMKLRGCLGHCGVWRVGSVFLGPFGFVWPILFVGFGGLRVHLGRGGFAWRIGLGPRGERGTRRCGGAKRLLEIWIAWGWKWGWGGVGLGSGVPCRWDGLGRRFGCLGTRLCPAAGVRGASTGLRGVLTGLRGATTGLRVVSTGLRVVLTGLRG